MDLCPFCVMDNSGFRTLLRVLKPRVAEDTADMQARLQISILYEMNFVRGLYCTRGTSVGVKYASLRGMHENKQREAQYVTSPPPQMPYLKKQ
ncbi:hypothetical protein Baya_7670 [Bagarius yarrelli]|uniref:Uncharacterized protein n=1 Tax=Bagarius yarrelli TaxID=175774 RepID=A0A556U3W9_BAGYA|nr:hypothetical protein Baya_7670 [Bagarius yarrelli]